MRNTMKKFISTLIFATVVALGLASCSKTDANLEKISGEWYWNSTESGVDMEVYVAFHTDATFDLYQKLGEGAFRHYKLCFWCKIYEKLHRNIYLRRRNS